MPSIIIQTLLCGLAFISAVQAIPRPQEAASAVAIAPTATSTPAEPPVDNSDLFKDLLTAPTTLKRFQRLLTAAGQKLLSAEELKKLVVFDFNGAKPGDLPAKFAGIETFPILTDLGISSALASLEPCSMSPPHFHPRATEFFTVIEGSADFFYILENGLVTAGQDDVITGHLDKFQATVFPRTSVHYQINPTCEKSVFIATFSSEDPGTQVVNRTVPQGAIEKCRQTCNIKPKQ